MQRLILICSEIFRNSRFEIEADYSSQLSKTFLTEKCPANFQVCSSLKILLNRYGIQRLSAKLTITQYKLLIVFWRKPFSTISVNRQSCLSCVNEIVLAMCQSECNNFRLSHSQCSRTWEEGQTIVRAECHK